MRYTVLTGGAAALLLLLAAFATGFIFHAHPYGETRNAWFAWHRTLGLAVPVVAVSAALMGGRHSPSSSLDRLGRGAAWLLLVALLATGWVAVSGWADPGGSGTLLGGLRLPLLPVSREVGDHAEQWHKLLVTLLTWLLLLYVGRLAWRRFGRWRAQAGASASSP